MLSQHRTLTVLWDNDGILVDTEGLFFRATQAVLSSVGVQLSPAQFIEYSLKRGESTFQLAAECGVSPDEINRLRAQRDHLYADSLRTSECVITGVEEALRRLHGHVRMGVVTSSRRVHFEIAHANSGLLGFFDFVIAREDYEHSKPHPEPYLTALESHQLWPKDCVVVEDSERGLAAATAAGLRCLVIPNEWTRQGNFEAAWKTVAGIADVPEEVFQLSRPARPSQNG
jgi:HAD superfamily hydrolase (TIGR01509 family)